MAFPAREPVGANFTLTSTTQKFPLGTKGEAVGGQPFVYVKASEAITQYMAVTIDEDGLALKETKAALDDGHQVGFAQVGFSSGDYGWVAQGPALTTSTNGTDTVKVLVATLCAADVALYSSATAGILDDASTSQTKVEGAVITATNALTVAAAVEAILTYPRSGGF